MLCCVGYCCVWCAYFVWIFFFNLGFLLHMNMLCCLFGCDIVYYFFMFLHICHDVMFFISLCYVNFFIFSNGLCFVVFYCFVFCLILICFDLFCCVFFHHVLLCFGNILEFVWHWDMFKGMILLENFCCDFTILLIYLVFL